MTEELKEFRELMSQQVQQQYMHNRIEDQRRNNSLMDSLEYYHPDKMVAILHVGGTPDTIGRLASTVIHRFLKKTGVKTLLELRTDFKQLHFGLSFEGTWFITLTALYDSDKAKESVEGSRLDCETWYKV